MGARLEYHVVDVFTQVPLEGNPLAVFPDGRELDGATMQRIARELNLSETTFVLPASRPDAAADVRIFTPGSEMKFAGHPTLGTAFVMRERGIVERTAERFALHEKIGLVPVRVECEGDAPMFWLETPPISFGATLDRAASAAAVGLEEDDLVPGIPCRIVGAGNPSLFIPVREKAAVDRARVDSVRLRALLAEHGASTFVFPFAPVPGGAYSRMFAEELGVVEDPATGSATGPLAAFMMHYGLAPSHDGARFVSEQGTKMGRRSYVHVLVRGTNGSGAIEVGGYVTPLTEAVMTLEPAAKSAV